MPEVALTVTPAPDKWSLTGTALTIAAVDNTSGNKFAAAADMLIVVQNTDSGAHSIQFTSQPILPSGRLGSISQSLAAGEIRVFRMTSNGWANAGFVFLPTGQSAYLKVGIVKLG